MNLVGTKILTMVILGGVSFLIGLSTIKLRDIIGLRRATTNSIQSKITSFLLCFGAGVLLETSLLHILPEMREGLEETSEKLEIEWLAELIICAGFFMVYLMEEAVHLMLSSTKHSEPLHRTMSVRKSSTAKNNPDEKINTPESVESAVDQHSSEHSHLHVSPGSNSTLRDFFTVLALSFHAIFEGMAAGLAEDNADVWALFTAISVHKFVITFCMSIELLQAGVKMKLFLLYLLTFCIVTPLGIGLGMIISETTSESYNELTVSTLQGLAGGTILYVVMFEVLQRERSREVNSILQLSAILLGFIGMLIVQLFFDHDHDEEAEEHMDQPLSNTFLNFAKH